MTRWLIDNTPFGALAKELSAQAGLPSGIAHIVEHVADKAPQDQSGREAAMLRLVGAAGPVVQVHQISAESACTQFLFEQLRPDGDMTARNMEEHVAIAYCATDFPDSIFVAGDKGAVFLGLAELGPGRVATPFDYWDHLRQSKVIGEEQFRRLCEVTQKKVGLPNVPKRFA